MQDSRGRNCRYVLLGEEKPYSGDGFHQHRVPKGKMARNHHDYDSRGWRPLPRRVRARVASILLPWCIQPDSQFLALPSRPTYICNLRHECHVH